MFVWRSLSISTTDIGFVSFWQELDLIYHEIFLVEGLSLRKVMGCLSDRYRSNKFSLKEKIRKIGNDDI